MMIPLTLAVVAAAALVLPAKSPVEVELLENLNSRHTRTGEQVRFRIAEDLRVGEHLVLAKGTPVEGRVRHAEESRPNGRAGALQVVIPRLPAAGGRAIPLFGQLDRAGRDRSGASSVTQILVGVVGFGVHGREASHSKGDRFIVYTRQEESLEPPPDVRAAAGEAGSGAAAPATAAGAGSGPVRSLDLPLEPLLIEYRTAKGKFKPDVLEIVLPAHEDLAGIAPETVALAGIEGVELGARIRPESVEPKRAGWAIRFEPWKIVRHLSGSAQGKDNRAWLEVRSPEGAAAHVKITLKLLTLDE